MTSPYSTPFLLVRKAVRGYRLVQDLRLINEAMIPARPIVPNPYTLLCDIPSSMTHFTVIELKDAFSLFPYTQTASSSLLSHGPIQKPDSPPS